MPTVGYISLLVGWSLVSGLLVLAGLLLASPAVLGPFGVTAWFLLLLAFLTPALTLVLYVVKAFLQIHSSMRSRLRYSQRQGFLSAAWVVCALALSSLRQFGLKDGVLLALLLLIIEVYVRFRWP